MSDLYLCGQLIVVKILVQCVWSDNGNHLGCDVRARTQGVPEPDPIPLDIRLWPECGLTHDISRDPSQGGRCGISRVPLLFRCELGILPPDEGWHLVTWVNPSLRAGVSHRRHSVGDTVDK